MIVKSEAIEPKASSANSVYPAIIVSIGDVNENNAFLYLQFFCPDIMSGTPEDAKYGMNNWVDAPRYPHNGADAYDFQVGGVIMISFENGNIDCPQFVRYVNVADSVVQQNAMYVNGADITAEGIFTNIFDNDITTSTPGLQKGMAILPAVEACGKKYGVFHTYGFDKTGLFSKLKGAQAITIFKCGNFASEIIFKHQSNFFFPDYMEANADYLSGQNYSFFNICKFLLQNDNTDSVDKNIVGIVNSVINSFESDSKFKKDMYDKTNVADIAYWYMMLAGYCYPEDSNKNKVDQFSPAYADKISKDKLKVSYPPAGSNMHTILCNSEARNSDIGVSLYNNLMRNSTPVTSDKRRSLQFSFISALWKKLMNSSYFYEKIASRYAMIVSNHIFTMRTTYSVDSLDNKALLVNAMIATAFPALEKTLTNLSIIDSNIYDDKAKSFAQNLLSYLKDSSPNPDKNTLANGYCDMYFQCLGWDEVEDGTSEESSKTWKYDYNPHTKIKNMMLAGISYIYDNYSSISSIMLQNTGSTNNGSSGYYGDGGGVSRYGLMWPFPKVTRISSEFGNRVLNGQPGWHSGIDISNGKCGGMDVVAARDGTVVVASPNSSYGNYVIIKHDGTNMYTLYAHLQKYVVSAGAKVKIGQVIGKCDNTGHSFGNHLHFEVRIGSNARSNAQNPKLYVSASNTGPTVSGGNGAGSYRTGAPKSGYYNVNLSHDVQDYLFQCCTKYGIPSALMIGNIEKESGFNPNAIGKNSNGTKDYGLCQINSSNHANLRKTLGVTNFLDPKQSILCGCYILSAPGIGFDTPMNIAKSLMCYGYGTAGAKRKWKNYSTTNDYLNDKVVKPKYERFLYYSQQ